ncbi:hypothetical protein WOLCODRAFT_20598 [Wolfiporia cocos MD-104 SS10]|uniref:Alpha-type protein kinase domain-containing protein n=1 Tax=Wolfiporia cocos (strain MD-104) TaxID=742152 RepID=A0A2H3JIL9_WOLCO|nr:hypothetical protein WOLCODRAFT_20598 [Wolfiporia cocos MD-104 SS10]
MLWHLQCFYEENTKRIPFGGKKQMLMLALGLWVEVKLKEKEWISAYGMPPFELPDLRFVEAALAVKSCTSEEPMEAYMLEEVISVNNGGFHKYLNNNSVIPHQFNDPVDMALANYLAYTQHAQYWLMGKMAFVTDYQDICRGKYHSRL